MKTAVLTFAAVAAQLVAAQSRADYFPSCALDCLAKGTTDATNCAADDAWCWCIQANYEAIYDASQICVLSDCGAVVALNDVLPAAIPFCSEATKQHAAATQVPDKETSAPAEATPTAAEEKPTTPAAEPTQAESTAAAQQSSAAAGQSSKPTSAPAAASSSAAAVPAASDCSTVVVAPTKSSNATMPKPTASVVVVPTGAAVQIGSMGAAAMLVLGALAAF